MILSAETTGATGYHGTTYSMIPGIRCDTRTVIAEQYILLSCEIYLMAPYSFPLSLPIPRPLLTHSLLPAPLLLLTLSLLTANPPLLFPFSLPPSPSSDLSLFDLPLLWYLPEPWSVSVYRSQRYHGTTEAASSEHSALTYQYSNKPEFNSFACWQSHSGILEIYHNMQ